MIPVYNRRAFLTQAINSSLCQTASNVEIVVSDDCSSEDLRSSVEAFRDARIRYYRNGVQLGAARNHQQAVSLAQGLFVIALNSDDLVLPNCLEVAGQALKKWENAAAAYFSTTYLVGSSVQGCHEIPSLEFANDATLAENSWLEGYHCTSPTCCLFRKAAFDAVGGYRAKLRFAYDWDLYMRFIRNGGGVVFVPEVLSIYRKHPEQMINAHSIDAVLDVLDMWHLPEYSHWSSVTIAGLVLTHCMSTVRQGGSLRAVFKKLRECKLKYKLWLGLPGVLLQKAGLLGDARTSADANYRTPERVDLAIEAARALLKAQLS